MDSNIKKNLIGLGLFTLFVLLVMRLAKPSGGCLTSGQLVQALSNERQIHMGVQQFALEQETAGNYKSAWPADSGVKTGREYVKYLIDSGVFKRSDMRIFATVGYTPTHDSDHLTTNNIAFRFANVSKDDPPNTIFIVTNNYFTLTAAQKTARESWWEIFFPPKATPSLMNSVVIFRKDGTGEWYAMPLDKNKIKGLLPPREPKFLPP